MPTHVIYGYSASALAYNSNTGAFELDPNFDFTQDRIKITFQDDDTEFDGDDESYYNGDEDDYGEHPDNEVGSDSNQTAVVTTPDGTLIASGLVYDEAYAEISLPGGGTAWLERVEINGQHLGYISSVNLTPGQSYPVSYSVDVYAPNTLSYSQLNSIPCFGGETLIDAENGPVEAAGIREGMRVQTMADGPQPVRAVLKTAARGRDLFAICRGALGAGVPYRTVYLTGDHAVLVTHPLCEALFGAAEVLVPVKCLAQAGLARRMRDSGKEMVYHLVLDRHHVVRCSGLPCETLHTSHMALRRMSIPQRMSLSRHTSLMKWQDGPTAHPRLKAFEGRLLVRLIADAKQGRAGAMRKKRIATLGAVA